jgi:hypothetical protein
MSADLVPRLSTAAGTPIDGVAAPIVYLPNRDRLEARSRLRSHLDNPDDVGVRVRVRVRGATPPNVFLWVSKIARRIAFDDRYGEHTASCVVDESSGSFAEMWVR